MTQIQIREDLKHLLKEYDLFKYPAASIGIAEGLFDRDMLNWGLSKLYSIDPFIFQPNIKGDGNSPQKWHDDNYNNAAELLSQFGERSVIVKDYSVNASRQIQDNSIGFLYMDGDHRYEGVLADLNAWWPKLINGAVIAGHDYLCPEYGVKQAVTEFAAEKGLHVFVIPDIDKEHAGFWMRKPLQYNPVLSGEIEAQ